MDDFASRAAATLLESQQEQQQQQQQQQQPLPPQPPQPQPQPPPPPPQQQQVMPPQAMPQQMYPPYQQYPPMGYYPVGDHMGMAGGGHGPQFTREAQNAMAQFLHVALAGAGSHQREYRDGDPYRNCTPLMLMPPHIPRS